jgi:ribosomal protein S18 acetylase RimI-like enzyme
VFAGIEPESWKELRHEAGYIHDLVVDERHRGRAIGGALIGRAVDWFRARGSARVMLWTAVSNAAAQKLFRAAGFRPTMIEMTLDQRAPTEEP